MNNQASTQSNDILYSKIYIRYPHPYYKGKFLNLKDKPATQFKIYGQTVSIYVDTDNKVQAVIIFIPHGKPNPDIKARFIAKCVESMLKASCDNNFKFSPNCVKLEINEQKVPKEKIVGLISKFPQKAPRNTPRFDKNSFDNLVPLYLERPEKFVLLTDSTNETFSPIYRYLCLYKIIESIFQSSTIREKTKEILKNSSLLKITKNFEYNGLKGSSLIDYIVDLRDKCSHLKDSDDINFYGISPVNIKEVDEVKKFLPVMTQICAQTLGIKFEAIKE